MVVFIAVYLWSERGKFIFKELVCFTVVDDYLQQLAELQS